MKALTKLTLDILVSGQHSTIVRMNMSLVGHHAQVLVVDDLTNCVVVQVALFVELHAQFAHAFDSVKYDHELSVVTVDG